MIKHERIKGFRLSKARFNIVPAGRRSYKTETAKRKILFGNYYQGLNGALTMSDGNFFFAAPTRDQVKRIAWNDLKMLTFPFWSKRPSESELTIFLKTGSQISCIGMDKPQRIEGNQWHGGILDEYADMKKEAFDENVRPALSDTLGWCDMIGVPDGINHYKEIYDYAKEGKDEDFNAFTWKSADVLDLNEIESAKRQLDERTFRQEYEASFETAQGRVYYNFIRSKHVVALNYVQSLPLRMSFDFNFSESPMTTSLSQILNETTINVLDCVNTKADLHSHCKDLKSRLNGIKFNGTIFIYGDASKVHSIESNLTNWQIVKQYFPESDKVIYKVPRSNPSVIDRVNSVCTKLRNAAKEISLFVNSHGCNELVKDFEQVVWQDNKRDIDKSDRMRTHNVDNIGYMVWQEFPLRPELKTSSGWAM